MNAEKAIEAHRKWKERFYIAMQKREHLNVAEILADNCCEFGQWLHGEAKEKFGHLASYRTCVELHAAFHQEAGKVAQDINTGNFLEANKKMVMLNAPYAQASGALSVGVVAMFQEVTTLK
jgi:methyl-accepting chemotaxis protein